MRQELSQPKRPKTLALVSMWIGALVALTAVYACSAIIERSTSQCTGATDCGTGYACSKDGLCVGVGGSSSSSSSSSSSGKPDSGCPIPQTDIDFLNNLCANNTCIRFDNVKNIAWFADAGADAALPDLDASL